MQPGHLEIADEIGEFFYTTKNKTGEREYVGLKFLDDSAGLCIHTLTMQSESVKINVTTEIGVGSRAACN
jgi:hypothetical protein